MVSDAKRAANNKWDAENMAVITCKIKKELADEFKAKCRENGVTANSVISQAVKIYIEKN